MIIKFTQRDGYGSSIEFIERRGSDGADVDEKNNGFGPACRNSKRLVEYIGGFAAVQTFVDVYKRQQCKRAAAPYRRLLRNAAVRSGETHPSMQVMC